MKRLYSEWDIGHDGLVFKTEQAAHKWLAENENLQEMIGPEEDFQSLQDILDDGLIGIQDVEVIE